MRRRQEKTVYIVGFSLPSMLQGMLIHARMLKSAAGAAAAAAGTAAAEAAGTGVAAAADTAAADIVVAVGTAVAGTAAEDHRQAAAAQDLLRQDTWARDPTRWAVGCCPDTRTQSR